MPRKRADNRDKNERREDALRPCRYLGYDRDRLAMYLMQRGAYEIAESQFRRAIWLNPFEPRFKAHFAWCLHKQGRHNEAVECLAEIPSDSKDEEIGTITRLITQNVPDARTEDCE